MNKVFQNTVIILGEKGGTTKVGREVGNQIMLKHCSSKHYFIQKQTGLQCVFLAPKWVLICHMQLFTTKCCVLNIGSCSCSQRNCGNPCSSLKPQGKQQLLVAMTLRLEILPQKPRQLFSRLVLSQNLKGFKDPLFSAQILFNHSSFASLTNAS